MLTFTDILRARRTVGGSLPPTPMWSYPALNEAAGARLHVKHENVQPVGAFKVRGGVAFLANLSATDRERGVVSYSTGNHAQSLAYAAAAAGVPCLIVMPEPANETKVLALRSLGAAVEMYGAKLDEAGAHATRLARDHGRRLVTPGDEPELLAGVGTAYVEMFESAPELDTLIVPVGSGTGAAAACLVAAALAPHCEVIGVQAAASPAAYESWRAGACVVRENRTTVDGLATGRGCQLPQRILREKLHDFLLVTDEEIRLAGRLLISHAHTLAEGAGAAALAAVMHDRERFAGRTIGIPCTGGNASAAEVAGLLREGGRDLEPLPA